LDFEASFNSTSESAISISSQPSLTSRLVASLQEITLVNILPHPPYQLPRKGFFLVYSYLSEWQLKAWPTGMLDFPVPGI
jgi:hypothetical protein